MGLGDRHFNPSLLTLAPATFQTHPPENMLVTRLITGTILIASLIGLVWLDTLFACQGADGGLVLLCLFSLVIVPLAAIEAASLLKKCGLNTPRLVVIVLALWMLGSAFAAGWISQIHQVAGLTLALIAPAVALAVAVFCSGWGGQIQGAWTSACGMVGVAIWIGLASAFWLLACLDHSTWLVAGLLLVVKMGDIGAYFTGMLLGKHKLIPWLSPGKTVEGFVGGLVLGGIAGLVLAAISASAAPQNQLSLIAGVVGGVLLTLSGAFGDLAESLLKRAAEVKDSGRSIPGMGGVLDVLDSPLAAGPVAFLVLLLGTAG